MDKNLITKLFTEACSINSPSGDEREIAEWIKNKLEPLDWEVWTDDTGEENKSNTGNLYAYFEIDDKIETVAFSAHMDTVAKKGDKIKVIFDGEVFKSDGTTILGADNRGGLVPLINFGLNIKKDELKNNLLLFFPTREEEGIMGSKFFKFDKSKIKYIFNMDGGQNPGTFVYKSLGFLNFTIEIYGVASHAAAAYEQGKNAILIASELIKVLPLGKNEKEGTTLNIGRIKGGGATNIVPDFVEIEGELRAFELEKMEELFSFVESKCEETTKKFGVKFKLIKDSDKSFSGPLWGTLDSNICEMVKEAAKKIGLKPVFETAFYSTDANHFSKSGYETIVVTRGGKNAHSKDEQTTLSDLVKTSELVEKLVYTS